MAQMLERYVYKNQKKMRCGYTTGTCAAAAAKAAAQMLLSGRKVTEVSVRTPSDITLTLPVCEIQMKAHAVSCAVQKDSGDDPDITNKILIFAEVSYIHNNSNMNKSTDMTVKKCDTESERSDTAAVKPQMIVDGGVGIGRITKKGLARPVGAAAINPVPLKMIEAALKETAEAFGYEGGLQAVISAPQGVEIAKKTFNPQLGITGGISILGTSGIVEPMSEQALIEEQEQEPDTETPKKLEHVSGQIDIEHVAFSYVPSQPLIRDLNLSVFPYPVPAPVPRSAQTLSQHMQ